MQLNGVGWQSVEPSLEHSLGSTEATESWELASTSQCDLYYAYISNVTL